MGNAHVILERKWAMPNKNTFSIKPIKEMLENVIATLPSGAVIADPFANSNTYGTITNDLDEQYDTTYHMDALDFLRQLGTASVDMILYDPPYSPRQIAECYKTLGASVNMQTTQSSYWAKQKAEIARVVKPGGYVFTCSWNSGGIGKKYGFEVQKVLLVTHGSWHNDTIAVLDRKM